MPTVIEEEYQRFTFDNAWTIFRYDCAEAGYHSIRDCVVGTRSCDFAGVLSNTGYLIEVKDFRGFRIQNKKRVDDGELIEEVAQKIRDTLAGIISGVRRGDSQRPWDTLLRKHLGKPDGEFTVILSLEDDAAADERRWKQRLSILSAQLKSKLSWLRVRVSVVSPQTFPNSIPGVAVSNLPGACGHAARRI